MAESHRTLSEPDKDRIAGLWRRYVEGDRELWPEGKLGAAVQAEFGFEGCAFLSGLLLAVIAHHDELGPDPIIQAIDAAEGRGDDTVDRMIPGEHL